MSATGLDWLPRPARLRMQAAAHEEAAAGLYRRAGELRAAALAEEDRAREAAGVKQDAAEVAALAGTDRVAVRG